VDGGGGSKDARCFASVPGEADAVADATPLALVGEADVDGGGGRGEQVATAGGGGSPSAAGAAGSVDAGGGRPPGTPFDELERKARPAASVPGVLAAGGGGRVTLAGPPAAGGGGNVDEAEVAAAGGGGNVVPPTGSAPPLGRVMRTTDGTPSGPVTEPRADDGAGAAAAAVAVVLPGAPLTKSVKFIAVTPVPRASVPPRACRLLTAERGGVAVTPVTESE